MLTDEPLVDRVLDLTDLALAVDRGSRDQKLFRPGTGRIAARGFLALRAFVCRRSSYHRRALVQVVDRDIVDGDSAKTRPGRGMTNVRNRVFVHPSFQ